MAGKFFRFDGVEHRVYPALALEVDPGQIVKFDSGEPPADGLWVRSSEKAAKDQVDGDDQPVEVADQTPDQPDSSPAAVHPEDAPAA